ncbi:GNAT family N-acetyltransferase [Chromobacterium amazonense]|uniref:GNAT family N-acetyltransferase n=2 Tax=Chromobacterium amazonense TaxID=1382803 RepID=UPI00137929BB
MMEILSQPYQTLPRTLRRECAVMLHQAYQCPGEPDPDDTLHKPEYHAQAFCLLQRGRLVAYAAVLGFTVSHGGQAFALAALSCVATHPGHRRQGLGERVVAAASAWLRECGKYDIAAFTCDAELAPFYARAAAWRTVDDVVLLAHSGNHALRSDRLGKTVVLELLSARAQSAAAAFRSTTINLGLPEGEFI